MASLLNILTPIHIFRFIILFTLVHIPLYLSSSVDHRGCDNLFSCGNISKIGFPFWGVNRPNECGHPELHLTCQNNISYITIKNVKYQVKEANPYEHSLRITREDYLQGLCPSKLVNSTFDTKLFVYGTYYNNLTLFYGCHASNNALPSSIGRFSCFLNGNSDDYVYTWFESFGPPALSCQKSVVVPVSPLFVNINDFTKTLEAIREGFVVRWKVGIEECGNCQKSGGSCSYNWLSNQTICNCKDQSCSNVIPDAKAPPRSQESPPQDKSSSKVAVGIGVAAGVAVLVGILACGCFVVRRRRRNAESSRSKELFMPTSSSGTLTSTTNMSQSVPSYPSSKSHDTVQKSFYFGVQVFTYAELEEATNNFHTSREIGEGGFGTVYKGELKDGRVVAVKRHYESNFKRVEQFMNEVEILAHLRHKNLVTLFGCTSRHSRELLLVYEFIPNGTVADHLHGKSSKSTLLPWSVRLNIAVETAEALAFLHASDVIHRDVKSNNILLDEKFHVKVADFGLSRLFPNQVTHVSTAPQGTPGYVDPEYYQLYQLTDKSDVYSFGVVLVELLSSLQAVDISRSRNDVNLANMAISKIQNQELHELVEPYIGFEKDPAVRRMTTAVAELAFRCLQQERDMRPSMDEVLEILRGIKSDELDTKEGRVVDAVNRTDEVVLLKKVGSPISPNSVADKWVSGSSTSTSS